MKKFLTSIGILCCLFLLTLFYFFIHDVYRFYQHNNARLENKSSVPIVFAGDDGYVTPILVALTSLNLNTKTKIDVFILTSGFSQENQSLLNKLDKRLNHIQIKIISVDESYFKNLPVNKNWSTGIYYRYLIPLIFKDYQKVLYLDGDILVLKDLTKLFATNIENYALAGVNDADLDFFLKKPLFNKQNFYINSGMLLINIDKFKTKVNNLFITTNMYKNTFTHYDQDAINLIFKDEIKLLPPKYNTLVNTEIPSLQTVIYHYSGQPKPWKEKAIHFYEWQKYQAFMTAILDDKGFPFFIYPVYLFNKLSFYGQRGFAKLFY